MELKKIVLVLAVAGPLTLLFSGTFRALVAEWDTNIYYSHGYLVLPVAAWLLWRERAALTALPRTPSGWGLFLLAIGLLVHALGVRADMLFAQGLSLILVLAGLIHSVWGRQVLKQAAFPLFVLIFMVPLPYLLLDPLGFPLKLFAARQTTSVLQAAGLPLLREGVYLYLPTYTLVIEDVCSGLRSLISMVTLGTIFAYMSQPSALRRTVLVVAAIPISLAANIVRIAATVLMAYYISGEVATGFLHEFSGFFVFILSLAILLLVGRTLKWTDGTGISWRPSR